jgi:hypothetical protein
VSAADRSRIRRRMVLRPRPQGPSAPDFFNSLLVEHLRLDSVERKMPTSLRPKVTSAGVDSLKVLFEPFEDRFHRFIRPFPIHIEVDAAF